MLEENFTFLGLKHKYCRGHVGSLQDCTGSQWGEPRKADHLNKLSSGVRFDQIHNLMLDSLGWGAVWGGLFFFLFVSVKCLDLIPFCKLSFETECYLSVYPKHLIFFSFSAVLTIFEIGSDVIFIWFTNSVVM